MVTHVTDCRIMNLFPGYAGRGTMAVSGTINGRTATLSRRFPRAPRLISLDEPPAAVDDAAVCHRLERAWKTVAAAAKKSNLDLDAATRLLATRYRPV